MPTITRVSINDLVASTQKYADDRIGKADANKNGYVTRTEAKGLAADLQDNFAGSQFAQSWGSVKTADLKREYVVMMNAFARSSDTNRDGYLSVTEAKTLPMSLQDNFASYLASQQKTATDTGGYTTRNTTPSSRPASQLRAFGESAISYEEAVAAAVKAAATDEYGLRMFVQEYGGPDGAGLSDPAEIDAEVRSLLENGSVELVPVDADLPNGESVADAWIFSVHTDGQGDNGIWASVDRKTGETSVSSFN